MTIGSRRVSGMSVLIFGAMIACGPGRPSEADGERTLKEHIDRGNESRIKVIAFKKTDGVSAEEMSVPHYVMTFAAEAEFFERAMFSGGNSLVREGSDIALADYRPEAPSFSWDDWAAASNGFRRALPGDRLSLTGEITFEKRESGWRSTNIAFKFDHDSLRRGEAQVQRANRSENVGESSSSQNRIQISSLDRAAYYAALDSILKLSVDETLYNDAYARSTNSRFTPSEGIDVRFQPGSESSGRPWSLTATHSRLSSGEKCTAERSTSSTAINIVCTSQLGKLRRLLMLNGGEVSARRCTEFAEMHPIPRTRWYHRLTGRSRSIAAKLPPTKLPLEPDRSLGSIVYLKTGELCIGREAVVSIPDLSRGEPNTTFRIGISAAGPHSYRLLSIAIDERRVSWVVHPDSLLALSEPFAHDSSSPVLWSPNGSIVAMAVRDDMLAVHIPQGRVITIPLNADAHLDHILPQPKCANEVMWDGWGWAVSRAIDSKHLTWIGPDVLQTRVHLANEENPEFVRSCLPADSVANVAVDLSRGVASRIP